MYNVDRVVCSGFCSENVSNSLSAVSAPSRRQLFQEASVILRLPLIGFERIVRDESDLSTSIESVYSLSDNTSSTAAGDDRRKEFR